MITSAQALAAAEQGMGGYLETARSEGRIDRSACDAARKNAFPGFRHWLTNDVFAGVSPGLRGGLLKAVEAGRWEALVNAFRQSARFGTGGIRGMMGFDRKSIAELKERGFEAEIIRGPNTINEIVLLLCSAGVAQFGRAQDPRFRKVVIGYDSRIRGQDFARIVAELFLGYGYTVYFFDAPCPYPEVTYAIPSEAIKADVGILISASHNDYRYNGYKLSCSNGSQFDPKERDEMYNQYITKVVPEEIQRDKWLCPFADAGRDKLIFLGGEEPVEGFNYYGREGEILNIHARHARHVQSFLLTDDLAARQSRAAEPLKIAFCAYHGAGRVAVPRLLEEMGIPAGNILLVDKKPGTPPGEGMFDLNGLFPSFESAPGKERQPDPGDSRAAATAVEVFEAEHGSFEQVDILIGTDPDADRCGIVARVPEDQRDLYGGKSWTLLPADAMWSLLLWYRLHREAEQHGGAVPEADKKFIVLSHTTSEALIRLARKYGLGVIKTWVGFAALAASVRDVWENRPLKRLHEGRENPDDEFCDPFVCEYHDMPQGQRSINVGAFEQSNGFSLLGGPPPDRRSLGEGGHVRDKDGTLAALMCAEIAAWAKEQGSSIYELIDGRVYLDPEVGLFVTHYEPDPLDGEYPGIEGDRKKIEILKKALSCYRQAHEGKLDIAGRRVTAAAMYRTGKYDVLYPPSDHFVFADEGIRLYFGSSPGEKGPNHCTIRPSGTGNSLRFHVQLHEPAGEADLLEKKRRLMPDSVAVVDHLREILGAPRE